MTQPQEIEINYTLQTIAQAAQELWKFAAQYRILAFNGDMGAGKTTLIHTICEQLGVQDNVSSPTFALINEYHFTDHTHTDRTIYHMDWYRLKNEDEAVNAGMEDALLQPGAFCFVEWPGIAAGILPYPYVSIQIEVLSPTDRKLYATVLMKG